MNLFEQYDVESNSVYVTFDCDVQSTTTSAGAENQWRSNNWVTDVKDKYLSAINWEGPEIVSEEAVHRITNPMYYPIWTAIPVQ
jgi:hypothetical protein